MGFTGFPFHSPTPPSFEHLSNGIVCRSNIPPVKPEAAGEQSILRIALRAALAAPSVGRPDRRVSYCSHFLAVI